MIKRTKPSGLTDPYGIDHAAIFLLFYLKGVKLPPKAEEFREKLNTAIIKKTVEHIMNKEFNSH